LGELVEKERSGVCEADLAGTRRRAATDEREMRRGVMRRAERTCLEQRTRGIDEASNAVDRARDDRFVGIEWRHDPGQGAREQRLPRPGRTREEQAVPARCSDLERALRGLVPTDIGEVDCRAWRRGRWRDRGGRAPRLPSEVP